MNTEAFGIGQLIAGGEIENSLALIKLKQAALTAGLDPDEAHNTLNSGIESGKNSPRSRAVVPPVDLSALQSAFQAKNIPSDQRAEIEIKRLDEIPQNPFTKWLIKGWLPAGILGAIIAPSHTGKSLLALDWCSHVALGKEWQGNRTNQGGVVYLSGEGGRSGLGKRRQAWEFRHRTSLAGSPFYYIDCIPNLLDSTDTCRVIEALSPIHSITPIKLIVIDTKSVHMIGGDESSNDDGATFCRNLMALSKKYDATVLYVAHTGHSTSERERGASSTYAAIDACILMKKKGDHIEISSTKERDWNKPSPVIAKVITIPLGYTDEDGDVESSATLDYFAYQPETIQKEGKYVASLRGIVAKIGANKESVRKEFYDSFPWGPETNQDTKKKAFLRTWQAIENEFASSPTPYANALFIQPGQ